MAASLINVAVKDIGTDMVVGYTVPEDKSSMLLGCLVANTLGAINPVSVLVRKGAVDHFIAKAKRIGVGESLNPILGKVVLASGDQVVLSAGAMASADGLLSIAEGV
jgi:hypothetical protein